MTDTNHGPGNGATTPQAANNPNAAATQATRARRRLIGIISTFAVIALVAVAVTWLIATMILGGTQESNVAEPNTQTTTTANEPEPLDPDGVQSYTEFVKTASPAQWAAAAELGYSEEEIRRWAADEQLLGKNFSGNLKPGTQITNSGARGDGYYLLGYVVKDGDTLFLFTPEGKPAIKQSCGNPVGLPKEVVSQKPPQKETQQFCPPPTGGQNKPETPEVEGSIGQPVGDHRSPETPMGSERGEAEEVTDSQRENTDTNQPVEGGADANEGSIIDGHEDEADQGTGNELNDGVVTDD